MSVALLSSVSRTTRLMYKRAMVTFTKHRKSFNGVFCISKRRHSFGFQSYQSFGACLPAYGKPLETVTVSSHDISFDTNSNQILLKAHASPINPSDINIIEGRYALLPKSLPTYIGNDGIFEVYKKGKLCSSSSPAIGQCVVPFKPLLGTWQQYIACTESDIIPLNVNLSDFEKYDQHLLAQLSMITVNPCTAYRMINDFVCLDEGDYIIQNAANSAIGECVIQIARNYGLKTLNIIRGSMGGTAHRSAQQFKNIKEYLIGLGADIVVGDEDIAKMSREDRDQLMEKKPPKLGLNGVGGKVVGDMMKFMTSKEKTALVTYGGMSKQPLSIPTGPLIFRDISLTGFWMSAWKAKCEADLNMMEEYLDMIKTLTEMIKDHDLEVSYKLVRFGEEGQGMTSALKYAMNEMEQIHEYDEKFLLHLEENQTPEEIRGKVIMIFNEPGISC